MRVTDPWSRRTEHAKNHETREIKGSVNYFKSWITDVHEEKLFRQIIFFCSRNLRMYHDRRHGRRITENPDFSIEKDRFPCFIKQIVRLRFRRRNKQKNKSYNYDGYYFLLEEETRDTHKSSQEETNQTKKHPFKKKTNIDVLFNCLECFLLLMSSLDIDWNWSSSPKGRQHLLYRDCLHTTFSSWVRNHPKTKTTRGMTGRIDCL